MGLCKKNELAKLHDKFKQTFPDEVDFIPETFSLPSEREAIMTRMAGDEHSLQQNILDFREVPGNNNKNLWIVKPCIKSGKLSTDWQSQHIIRYLLS